MTQSHYIVSSFYKFVSLPEFADLKPKLLDAMNQYSILGTIILASEGMNGSIAGTPDAMTKIYAFLKKDERFNDLWFKENVSEFIPFDKAKVKLREEIVALGIKDVNPLETPGTYLSPQEWNELIADPDVLLIDTRNDYECNLGTFENAINPKTDHFREFPDYVEKNLLDKKDKKIAMCCTGGIRCEKSTAYLKKLGFKSVYQLHGGILNYLEQIPEAESKWHGTCFVFDDRIAVEQV